jgi:hypothetical protein
MPEPVKCPDGECRKSIAIYYVAERREDAYIRNKALFQARPIDAIREDQTKFEAYDKLCNIRVERILTSEDMKELAPGWKPRWTR